MFALSNFILDKINFIEVNEFLFSLFLSMRQLTFFVFFSNFFFKLRNFVYVFFKAKKHVYILEKDTYFVMNFFLYKNINKKCFQINFNKNNIVKTKSSYFSRTDSVSE